ncbi:MFS general substrate transporter [Trichoderma velutinum]
MSEDADKIETGDVVHDEAPETTEKRQALKDVGAEYAELADQMEFSPAAERKYLRRIDLILMPILFITWGLQYADKSILNSAAQFGIVQDLGLYTNVMTDDGTTVMNLNKFSYSIMLFYWGYFVGVFPATYIAQRMPLGKFVGCSIIIWGIVTISTAGVQSYAGLMVNRFFLGICESTPAPAFSLISAMWYQRHEQPLRIAIWYSASGVGSLLAGIAFYGIGHIHGALHPWKYQYIILGSVTAVWGIVVACFLPDNPTTARFLSHDERVLAVKRMRSAQTGIENTSFKPYQVREVFLDPKTYLLVLTAFTITLVNGAVSGFGSVVVKSFGFSPFNSVLLTGSVGAVVFVALLTTGICLLYVRNQRCNVFFFSSLLVITGCAVIWKSDWAHVGVPFAGFVLLAFFAVAYVMLLSLMTANTAGHTKKSVTSGLVWASTVTSNAVGPLLVDTTEAAQHYPSLVVPIIALVGLSIVMVGLLRIYMTYQNKRRDANSTVTEGGINQTAFQDLTDRENPNFRYSW